MRERGPGVPVRHGRLKRHGTARGVVQAVAVMLAVVAVSGVSLTAIAVGRTVGSVHGGVKLVREDGSAQKVPQVGAIQGEVNILLAGTDTRTGQSEFQGRAALADSSGAGNNDVTMVLHISADHRRATVLSIPRDLMTAIPACPRSGGGTYPASSVAQFNTSLSRGGLACTVLTVEKLTGLDIPYAAVISFDGVIAMSDAVGGVTVCLATPVKDKESTLDLPAGEQTLQGATALAFLRTRHGVGDGSDIGRIGVQQLFLSALMRKITSGGVLSNPVTLYSLANAAVKNMEFSDTLSSPITMVSIASALKGVQLQDIVFVQYPTGASSLYPQRVVAAQPAATLLTKALDADQPITLSGGTGRATVAAPGASSAPTTAPPTTAPTTGAPTASSTPDPSSSAVELPSNVTGQTAAQQTCAKGYKG